MTIEKEGLYYKLYALEIPKAREYEQVEEIWMANYIQRITEWIEVGHLTAFEIEQYVKQDMEIQTIEPLESKIKEMEKTIDDCIELKEGDVNMEYKLKLTKVQSEWSGLQHFIRSLKSLMIEREQKRQVRGWIDDILVEIDVLSSMLFEFQEKRYQNLAYEELLVDIDNQVGPLFNDVERVYQRMTSGAPDEELVRKHMLVQERWEWLRIEIDEVKIELKEDRWLAVFKQVADQVEGMMDGLDKTVSQYIHQMRRNTPQSTCSTSSSESASSSGPLKSVEKNFDAKFKYYKPSIEKMLAMLGNGIAARMSKDTTTTLRHRSMIQRWDQLRLTMEHVRKRDSLDRPMSPATSRISETSSLRSPEPEFLRSRSPLFAESPHPPEDIMLQTRASRTQMRASPMMRRAMTPSLIPRPKTPSEIPRPRTSMARKTTVKKEVKRKYYKADMKDALDIEIATMINGSPVTIHCQRAQGQGKYYFGNGGNKKLYSCKLMNYRNQKNKVLIRVGGGWQDLEIFLLEHMNLVGN